MDHDQFIKTRPKLFHLTASSNVESIQKSKTLMPAAEVYRQAGLVDRISERRKEGEHVSVNGCQIYIRDQAPLYEGKMTLKGCTFNEFVEYLNEHVFFWPGSDGRPIDYGKRHFERYREEDCVVLEIDTAAIFAANVEIPPLFCKYNSGSPRCIPKTRRGSPRGRSVFCATEAFDEPPSKVVEVTFAGTIVIPWDQTTIRGVKEQLKKVN